MNNAHLIVVSTAALYKKCFIEAARGFVLNWHVPILHFVSLILLFVLSNFLALFGRIAVMFILGFVLALIMSFYLSTVYAAYEKEKFKYKESWERSVELFSPTISVLFFLFILDLLQSVFLKGFAQTPIALVVNLLIAVLLNPAPEVITYLRNPSFGFMSDCFDFIKENVVEWFIPFFVFLLPIAVFSFAMGKQIFLVLFTLNPVDLIEMIFFSLSSSILQTPSLVMVFVLLYGLYFIMIFRLHLFAELSTSTRRKRVYQYSSQL